MWLVACLVAPRHGSGSAGVCPVLPGMRGLEREDQQGLGGVMGYSTRIPDPQDRAEQETLTEVDHCSPVERQLQQYFELRTGRWLSWAELSKLEPIAFAAECDGPTLDECVASFGRADT